VGAEAHQVLTPAPGGGAGLAHPVGEILEHLELAVREAVAGVAENAQQLGGGAPGGDLDTAEVVLESGDRGGFASVDRAPPTGEPVDHPALWITEQLLDGAVISRTEVRMFDAGMNRDRCSARLLIPLLRLQPATPGREPHE
jgi:hypothetical protein